MTAQLKILGSLLFFKRYSLIIFYPNITVEASKDKRSICCRKFCRSGRKDQKCPTNCRNSTDSNWVSLLGHFPCYSVESTTSVLGCRRELETSVFLFRLMACCLIKSWNNPEVIWKWANPCRSSASRYFLPCRSHGVPRSLGVTDCTGFKWQNVHPSWRRKGDDTYAAALR